MYGCRAAMYFAIASVSHCKLWAWQITFHETNHAISLSTILFIHSIDMFTSFVRSIEAIDLSWNCHNIFVSMQLRRNVSHTHSLYFICLLGFLWMLWLPFNVRKTNIRFSNRIYKLLTHDSIRIECFIGSEHRV